MNGNELNNMAQRYKDEMMRLYRKSGASCGSRPAAEHTPPPPMPRDMAGTPVAGVPGAAHFGMNGGSQADGSVGGAINGSGTLTPGAVINGTAGNSSGYNVPVTCDCRFPSAQSIIDTAAGTPALLNRGQDAPQTYSAQAEAEPGPAVQAMAEADAGSADGSGLMGIMLNSAPQDGKYAMPADADAEREIYPDFDFPADIPAESGDAVPSTARHFPSMGWISITGDNGWGYLQFEVFTAGGSYPVQGAVVTVKKQLPGGTGLTRVLVTNRSGLTSTIALPAPTYSWKQHFSDSYRPFSEYTVTVRARGYYTLTDINIPIFAGVKSVQPIDLIPLPENSHTPIQPRSGGSVG